MFSMVLVGSGSVVFDTDPDPAIFYTDPDPGKLYRFHGSGSATLPASAIFFVFVFYLRQMSGHFLHKVSGNHIRRAVLNFNYILQE